MKKIGRIIHACRFKRTFWPMATMLIPIAWMSAFTWEVFALGLMLLLLYGAVSFHNFLADRDSPLPTKDCHKSIFLLTLVSFLISLTSPTLFKVFLVYVALGIFYNIFSRGLLFMDTLVLMFSHGSLPMFFTGLILGMPIDQLIPLTLTMGVISFSLLNVKQFKDTFDDKMRGYKTIVTEFSSSNSIKIMGMLFLISIIIGFLPYIIFELNRNFIALFLISIIFWMRIFYELKHSNFKRALSLTRFSFFIYISALIFVKSVSLPLLGFFLVLAGSYAFSDFIRGDWG